MSLLTAVPLPLGPGPVVKHDDQHNGFTAADLNTRVAEDMAALPSVPMWVLIHVGSNDIATANDEGKQAQFEGDLGEMLDAIHTALPDVKVYCAKTWRRNYMAESNLIAGWIDNVLATRSSWAFVGPDGRVWMENGDDGVTYTVDGGHPNAAGYSLEASLWKTILGY